MEEIIRVRNLVKKFGLPANTFLPAIATLRRWQAGGFRRWQAGQVTAVNDVSFEVKKGEVFGFLGPNGAGKTTTINVLCTLFKPTSGKAYLNGLDVTQKPHLVRQAIGLVFQDPSLDERLTARENLEFHGLIYQVPRLIREKRIDKILEMVELKGRQNDLVKTFSGGMRRRLEIARGLIHYPKVLFLDEPTLGLDPQTRTHIWDYIETLRRREEITIFLTTHYMEEAERCERIGVIDYGKIIALDSPANLKREVKGEVITLRTVDDEKAAQEIKAVYGFPLEFDTLGLHFEVENGEEFIPHFIPKFKTPILSVSLRKPTLDDVFLKLTGRAIREEKGGAIERMRVFARARRR